MSKKTSLFQVMYNGIFENNPVLICMLGICSALGVTTTVAISVTMGIAVCFVASFSSLLISCLRNFIPSHIRIMVQLTVISSFVIIVDQVLKAYSFEMSEKLSVFVGLIITNCLIMGRSEAFGINNTPIPSFFDGLGAGLGYSVVLIFVGLCRELIGFGQIYGYNVLPTQYTPNNLMLLPPAAFFLLGLMAAVINKSEE